MTLNFCSLASGSSGNCQFVETDHIRLLVDAGLSGKRIQNALLSIDVEPSSINGILVTHEHSDHTQGVGILSRRFNIPVYANQNTWRAMRNKLGKIAEENIKIINTEESFVLEDLQVTAFATYHDAEEPVGYVFEKAGKKISLLTDTGSVCSRIREKVQGSLLMLIESNHDVDMLKNGGYPWHLKKRILSDIGHLSNDSCGKLICDIHEEGCIYLLAHLSKENNTPETALTTVHEIVLDNGIAVGEEAFLEMTYRDQPSKVFNL
ncbi:MBL fold metallo-hydrolase [Vallitalea okinawensis]|uniref:MBL fold metallo-hydrolase n=1 Tax=Vallitalea okinawensis TaxID=2078660 RepID=UPI000CFA99F1|nr:MBL fold metallo-hydrolase [Vallitalea okinawensis]